MDDQEPVLISYEKPAAPKPPRKKWDLKEMLGLRGTEKKIVIGCLVVAALVLVVIVAGGLASDGSAKQVKFVVTSSGYWYGSYGSDGDMISWSNSENMTVTYTKESYTTSVEANIYVYNGEATLQNVSMSGKVLAEATSAESGNSLFVQWAP